MRIIFLSLAAVGAAALGGAGLAQTRSANTGPRPSAQVSPLTSFTPGAPRIVQSRARPPRRQRGGSFDRHALPFGYLGLGGYGGAADPYGSGYFADGGEVRMKDGRPVYDYDRSYPYEWPGAAASAPGRSADRSYSGGAPSCAVQRGVRVCRGRR